MTEKEAINMIEERAAELAAIPQIKVKLMEIIRDMGHEEAINDLYALAIATLYGRDAKAEDIIDGA